MTPTETVATYQAFCLAIIHYYKTNKERFLCDAMTHRRELIKAKAFTSDFLDGVQDGLQYSID